jgi:RNA polymerase sigma-70 factor (ECF subfamily)
MKEDERGAFRLLFNAYYDPLLLYCHRILDDLEAAEDVVQECFISLWYSKRLEHFSGDLDRFIFRVVKNHSLAYLRDKQRENLRHDAYARDRAAFPASDEEAFSDRTETLYLTINKLPERCRKIFLMACLDDRSYQEVADELDISVNTVKSQMKYALKFLRENLKNTSFLTLLIYLARLKPLPSPARL